MDHGSLLSYHTATELGLLNVNVNATTACSDITQSNLEIQYPSVFSGIGKLKDHQVKLHIDKNVVPVTQPHRRIPFHLRKKLENELDRVEQQGIIEKVNGRTPWVSPIVVAPKPKNPDEIRMCIDMMLPNRAIQRERHITPTVDDLIHDLNGSRVFSKLDLKSGYHQLELHPESRYITTFSTHKGLRRYTRLRSSRQPSNKSLKVSKVHATSAMISSSLVKRNRPTTKRFMPCLHVFETSISP